MKVLQVHLVLLSLVLLISKPGRAAAVDDVVNSIEPSNIAQGNEDLENSANHGGWVNPEDLMPMPQCIAHQDTSIWLNAMTKCTQKICINHVGPLICTRHQWLTQLSCLSLEISPDLVRNYLQHCGRSILAKAQLYSWVHEITGRTWLADAGDTNELRYLSPASLLAGYASVDVIQKAPMCLAGSIATISKESFQHVIASCTFTERSHHIGDEDRPWEYRESSGSIVSLDWATVGYDLTRRSIRSGEYFDRNCFCDIFSDGFDQGDCSGYDALDRTRQRLWINATCGPSSLPPGWKTELRTTTFDYIPVEIWTWPRCFADMPGHVVDKKDQCVTDACEVNTDGYCDIKRAVDRTCFCNAISYDSCKDSCHVFESRIDYIQWLHDLCGNVNGWHGLPEDWRQLAAPMISDLLPFPWTTRRQGPTASPQSSSLLKLAGLLLLNVTPFLAILLSEYFWKLFSTDTHHSGTSRPYPPLDQNTTTTHHKLAVRLSIATVNTLATILSILITQSTPGFQGLPLYQLILLWCAMPRLSWLASIFTLVKRPEIDTEAISTTLVMEWIYQVFASLTMLQAVQYGSAHGFYGGGMKNLDGHAPAKTMYVGALLWVVFGGLALLCLVHAMVGRDILGFVAYMAGSRSPTMFKSKRGERVTLVFDGQWPQGGRFSEHAGLLSGDAARRDNSYGAIDSSAYRHENLGEVSLRVYTISIGSFIVLWVAQWLFWGGFLDLTSGF